MAVFTTSAPVDRGRASRLLETALLITIVAHALAMVSMAALLLPGVPGGTQESVVARATYVGEHPRLWRVGWLPWQITAASDLWLSLVLVLTPWIPKRPAILALVATAAGVAADQSGQFSWTWRGVAEAQAAVASGDFSGYGRYEAAIFHRTAAWGAAGYIVGALAWTWCFAAAGVWSRTLTWLSVVTWGVFAAGTAVLFLPWDSAGWMLKAASMGNAVAFVLLMVWLVLVSEAVLRYREPDTAFGRHAPWRHPGRGLVARWSGVVANSRVARAIGRRVPAAVMVSDITGVVYVNYLVDAAVLEPLVRRPLALQRLGPAGRSAVFTFLCFRHGHFGPALFGRLRRWWPSPIQSNWRIHVYNPATGTRGIQFLSTAITSLPHALATRLLARDVPMHIPARADLDRDADGTLRLVLDPGTGTAPDALAEFRPSPEPVLDEAWARCFGRWRDLLAYIVPQDRALTVDPATGRVVRQEITLDIPLDACRPLSGRVRSRAAAAIAGDALPLCFAVDRVSFCFLHETFDG